MYKIEKRPSGYLLTFGGSIDATEMQRWYDESKRELASAPSSYGVIVDMRTLTPLLPEAQGIMIKGQALYKNKGMQRSAVILSNPIATMQFQRLAKESGIDAYERYIDASTTPEPAAVAVAWVKNGKDPGKL